MIPSVAAISETGIIGTSATLENVEIRLFHQNVEDLEISLTSPAGTILDLSSSNGGTGYNYTNTIFVDGAPNIKTGSAPFTGMFEAEGGTFASTFAGEQVNGDWVLNIFDNASPNPGSLLNFEINFTIEVLDPPVNTNEVFLDATGNITLDPADYDENVTDNCSIASVILSPNSFDCTDIGVQTVTMTVTDTAGNDTSCDYEITVTDNLPPAIVCPADQNETPDGMGMFTLPDYTGLATVNDNCSSGFTITQNPVSGTIVGTGTTTVTLSIMAGATTIDCTFDVIVTGTNTPPIITCPVDQTGDVDLNCEFLLPDYHH